MEIKIGYEEIHDYVKTHYKQDVKLKYISDKEVSLSVIKHILIKDVSVSVDVFIEEVKDDTITLRYKGGFGVDSLISGGLKFLLGKFPECCSAIITAEKNKVAVKLSEIKRLKSIFAHVELKDVTFAPEAVLVEFGLK